MHQAQVHSLCSYSEGIFHLLKAKHANTHIEDANGQTAESLYETYSYIRKEVWRRPIYD